MVGIRKSPHMLGRRIERGTALGGRNGRGGEGRMHWKPVGIAVGCCPCNEGGRVKGKGRQQDTTREREICQHGPCVSQACKNRTTHARGGRKSLPKKPSYTGVLHQTGGKQMTKQSTRKRKQTDNLGKTLHGRVSTEGKNNKKTFFLQLQWLSVCLKRDAVGFHPEGTHT